MAVGSWAAVGAVALAEPGVCPATFTGAIAETPNKNTIAMTEPTERKRIAENISLQASIKNFLILHQPNRNMISSLATEENYFFRILIAVWE
jgi:hypothetical protein